MCQGASSDGSRYGVRRSYGSTHVGQVSTPWGNQQQLPQRSWPSGTRQIPAPSRLKAGPCNISWRPRQGKPCGTLMRSGTADAVIKVHSATNNRNYSKCSKSLKEPRTLTDHVIKTWRKSKCRFRAPPASTNHA